MPAITPSGISSFRHALKWVVQGGLDTQGTFITQGTTNGAGMTDRIFTDDMKNLVVLIGDGDWGLEERTEEFDDTDEERTA